MNQGKPVLFYLRSYPRRSLPEPSACPHHAPRHRFLTCALLVVLATLGCSAGSHGSVPYAGAALTITTKTLGEGTVGNSYTDTLHASGGSSSGYTWKTSSGSLPSGLTLAADGAITGTPAATGTSVFAVLVTDSASNSASETLGITVVAPTEAGPLTSYSLLGDTSPVRDPSIMREGSTYYVFSTDPANATSHIPIRCSTDLVNWTACGHVFHSMPSWVASAVPAATNLWAPDISYFNGLYHLYYAASSFGSNLSAIGMATNTTLNPTDPNYQWIDHGMILESRSGDNFNAIDPNILVEGDGSVWLTYGSFWSGIFQRQIDPATGTIMVGGPIYHLAERAGSVTYDPIEGSSLIHSGSYYYLFVSWDFCCTPNPADSNYKIVVGRSTSPHGPFLDESGADMLQGGGTILLQGTTTWAGPGGQTAYIDPVHGDLIVFHALGLQQNGLGYLFVRSLTWSNGWPVVGTSP